jgi:hypothetical protein
MSAFLRDQQLDDQQVAQRPVPRRAWPRATQPGWLPAPPTGNRMRHARGEAADAQSEQNV